MKHLFLLSIGLAFSLISKSQTDTISENIYQNSSKLGIGISEPDAKLHVKDSISTLTYKFNSGHSQLKIGNSGTGYSGLILDAADGDGVGSDYFNIYQDDSLNLKLESMYHAGDIVFMTKLGLGQTAEKESMRIAKGGNVGIGINNPNYKLEIDGNVNLTSGNSFLINGQPLNINGSNWQLNNLDAYYSSGNIGIGTSEPDAKLHVKDSISTLTYKFNSGHSQLKIGNSGTGYSGLILDAADGDGVGSDYFNIYQDDSLNLKLESMYHAGDIVFMTKLGLGQTAEKESMRIAKGGNVGIGTNKPSAKLQVTDGDIYISDIEKGIIMKSPDGNCWRGVLDNTGHLNFSPIDCPDIVNEVTNLQQQIESENIMIYPNPTKTIINIELSNTQLKKLEYNIFNLTGQIQSNGKIKSNIETVDISSYSTGAYILSIYDKKGNKLTSQKIIRE